MSLTKPNVNDPIALRTALRTALERAGALAAGPVSLVVPDPAVRLALVPAEGLRGRGKEAQETVRFRLHKSLPFDVRTARLAWQVLPDGQALVAVSPEEVVRGYEEPLEALGLHPGPRGAGVPRPRLGARRRRRRGPPARELGRRLRVLPAAARTASRCSCARCRARRARKRSRARRWARCSSTATGSAATASPTWSCARRAAPRTRRWPCSPARSAGRRGSSSRGRALGIAERGAAAQAVAGAAACALRRTA